MSVKDFTEISNTGGAPQYKLREVQALEFAQAVTRAGNLPENYRIAVVSRRGTKLDDHLWIPTGSGAAAAVVEATERKTDRYMSVGMFPPEKVLRFKGRSQENCWGSFLFCADIDVGKGESRGYDTAQEAKQVVARVLHDYPAIAPNYVVQSGSGGWHFWWRLDAAITRSEWNPLAERLLRMLKSTGMRLDEDITTDAARIMRMPGSVRYTAIEAKEVLVSVRASEWRPTPYSVAEFSAALGADESPHPAALVSTVGGVAAGDPAINGDIAEQYTSFSYIKAAEKCRAMALAAKDNGKDTPYSVWIYAVRSAALSVDGVAYAHEISRGHADYTPKETDKKLASLTGGPASCAAWDKAWGSASPCPQCEQWEA